MKTSRLSCLLALLAVVVLAPSGQTQATLHASGCSGLDPVPTVIHEVGQLAPNKHNRVTLSGAPPGAFVIMYVGTKGFDAQGNPIAASGEGIPGVNPGCELNMVPNILSVVLNADANGQVKFNFLMKVGFGPDLFFQFAVYEDLRPLSIVTSQALHLHTPLTVTPDVAPLDFKDGRTGEPDILSVEFTNETFVPVTISDLLVFDVDASDFTPTPLTPLPAVLGVGQSLQAKVTFQPAMTGPKSAKLQVVHAGLPAAYDDPVIDLLGFALGPQGEDLLVDAGSMGPYMGGGGELWLADVRYTGGLPETVAAAITGTADPELYQTYRQGGAFSYAFDLPNGDYELTLHFAEPTVTGVGDRRFDVTVEGILVLDDLDLVAAAGPLSAHQEVVPVTILDERLDIDFAAPGRPAVIQAIELRRQFPRLEVSPLSHDFGSRAQGSPADVALTLTNTGTTDYELDSIGFDLIQGSGYDFILDLDGNEYVGDLDDIVHPASLSIAPQAVVPATLTFLPSEHSDNELDLIFAGNSDPATVQVHGFGGEEGHAFLHVVIEDVGTPVDYDGDGFEDVTLDGSLSHTHENGQSLTTYTWKEGPTTLATTDVTVQSFALGSHQVCLTIEDDNIPMESLVGCADFDVVQPDSVPGVLAHYAATGATPPANLLDTPPAQPDWAEVLPTASVPAASTVGSSPFTTNVLVRLFASVRIETADTYEFAAAGGVDSRLFVGGVPYAGPLALGTGNHPLEARFAVDTLTDLPLSVSMGPQGMVLAPIEADNLIHDETVHPPVLNAMTPTAGTTVGGNLVTLAGHGFFPAAQTTVHWGGQDLTEAQFQSIAPSQITFFSPPHAPGVVVATVETPQGVSNAKSFTYSAAGPPPIDFSYATAPTASQPTSGAWGPDGRLYVATRFGVIRAITFDENYNILSQTNYNGVSSLFNNEILGICFNPFDPPSPVKVYVAHAELFAQGGGAFTGPAPYPGQISVLTGPNFNSPVPLVTGLPTSNHDHGINGMVFDNNGDLLVNVGGNTNAGVRHPQIGDLPESPLSAAMLKVELSRPGFNGAVTYVDRFSQLPSDDQAAGGTAVLAPGSHVDVHAAGLRNAFDLVLSPNGYLYATDNGPNSGFGPGSTGPDTDTGNPSTPDEFLLVERGNYYGHANRARGFDDPRQNIYRNVTEPSVPGEFAQTIRTCSSSINGVDEYRATTFQSQMRGHMLVQRWNSVLDRLVLSADFRQVATRFQVHFFFDCLDILTGPGGSIIGLDYISNELHFLHANDSSAVGATAFDIFPWRAPATGGTLFVIGGRNFGTLGNTSVTIGGLPATVTSVSPRRITGTIPAQGSPTTDLLDVVVTTALQQTTIPAAFRYLFVPAGSEPGRWLVDPPQLPVAAGEVAAGRLGNKIHVVGEGTALTQTYDLQTNSWSTGTATTRAFPGHHHAAEVVDGKLYLIGGLGGGSSGIVQIYDPGTNSWSTGAPMPWGGGSVCTAAIDGKIYAAGGIVGSSTVVNCAVYDPVLDTWTPRAPMINGRNHAAVGTDGSKMWVFGGRGPGSGDANVVANGFADVQVYDPATDTWESSNDVGSSLVPLPIGRGGTGKAIWYEGEFYVFGGETLTGPGATPSNTYDRVDVYDPATNAWRQEADMPTARHGIFPILYQGRIFLLGGGIQAGNSQTKVAEVFTRQ